MTTPAKDSPLRTKTDDLIDALAKVKSLADWGSGHTQLDADEARALIKYIETLQR
jgi:hypothetical protein